MYWLDKLDGKWLPEFIANNDDTPNNYTTLLWTCLLDYLHTDLHTRIPTNRTDYRNVCFHFPKIIMFLNVMVV